MDQGNKIKFGNRRSISPKKSDKILIKMAKNPFQEERKLKNKHRKRKNRYSLNNSPVRIGLIGSGVKYFDKTRCDTLNSDLKTVRDTITNSPSKVKLAPVYENTSKTSSIKDQKSIQSRLSGAENISSRMKIPHQPAIKTKSTKVILFSM
ncbi:unnamed protein product [Moneuplotes crassus]|uniref:Uncharacterized protein n=1 Tax=Euplotes crassus TaxID=5936 RepID=A0AAD2D9G1_EUPCR|nr:unnamed protein product [Moneuplotes crassus]